MNYRRLGNSGLFISEICFGVMSFTGSKGWTHIAKTNQKDADELTAAAIDKGIKEKGDNAKILFLMEGSVTVPRIL